MPNAEIDWNRQLVDQWDWHWANQVRPRLVGLTDDEYFWEPVPDCWSVRPVDQVRTRRSTGSGPYRLEFEWPEPTPVPMTTIAWRIGHIIEGCLLKRSADHFGGEPFNREEFLYAPSADAALDQLDAASERWSTGVRALGNEGLARPCGPAEGPFATTPLAGLILHINKELIHHCAEVALLRDLYLRLGSTH